MKIKYMGRTWYFGFNYWVDNLTPRGYYGASFDIGPFSVFYKPRKKEK